MKKAADDLLNEGGVKFKIGWFNFRINKQKLGTILKISKQVMSMGDIDPEEGVIQNLYRNADNIRLAARIVALAVLNSFWKNFFYRIVSFYFMHKLDMKELSDLTKIVADQIGAQDFFFTMTLTRGMNFLTRKEKSSGEVKASTEPSQ